MKPSSCYSRELWCSRDGPWLLCRKMFAWHGNALCILQWDYFCIVVVVAKLLKSELSVQRLPPILLFYIYICSCTYTYIISVNR